LCLGREEPRYDLKAREVAMLEDLRVSCRHRQWFASCIGLASSVNLGGGDNACRAPDVFSLFAKLISSTKIKYIWIGI
jgi:hypothetical protein